MDATLALVSLAVSLPMGQQLYEEELAARAPEVLGPSWKIQRVVVRGLRSPLEGTLRLPSRVLVDGSPGVRRLLGALSYRGADVVHRLDLRLPPAPGTEVLTVHDVVSWRFPDEAAPPPAAMAEARRAAMVICPSQFSADEVSRVLGVREPVAIHNGVSPTFFDAEPLREDDLARLGVRPPFVLHAGGSSLRKNLGALAAAWPVVLRAHPGASLVLVGPPDPRRDVLFGPLPGTVLLGRAATADLLGIMAAAAAVVVPSLYEGFGLPALEAMATGAPVVAARRAALPEVCGDAALLVEPTGAGLAEGMVALLDGGAQVDALVRRGRERARRYTWQASAEAHTQIWRSVVA